jgi:uncharacterized protein involved in propanediol utilization
MELGLLQQVKAPVEKQSASLTDAGVCPSLTKTGKGSSSAHHGEIFQGVIEGPDGRLHRGLVSLPCDMFCSEATFTPDLTGVVRVTPHWKVKARKAIELFLARDGQNRRGGHLHIQSTVPIGWGLGSSTSDITAAIRATADAFGERITRREMAALAVEAETASDSTMFKYPLVLFAQREGAILERFSAQLPGLAVLGFNTDATRRGINTLELAPARYSCWEIEAFRPLVGLLRRAIETQDPKAIGCVATASSYINQRHLPVPHFDKLIKIRESVGALGLQVAHSGTVAGFLFDLHDPAKEHRINDAKQLVHETGFRETWRFQIEANDGDEEGVRD